MDAGIGVGNEHGLRAAADDLVGEGTLAGIVFGARRAEDLVHGNRMDMADERNSRQRKKVGVEKPLNGGLGGVLIHAAFQQQPLHIFISPSPLQEGKKGREAAERQPRFTQGTEAMSARLDEEGLSVDARGGVSLAEDGHAALLAAEVVAETDEFLGEFRGHLRSPRRWRPSCRAHASRRPWHRVPSWHLPYPGHRRPGYGWPCGGPSSRRG